MTNKNNCGKYTSNYLNLNFITIAVWVLVFWTPSCFVPKTQSHALNIFSILRFLESRSNFETLIWFTDPEANFVIAGEHKITLPDSNSLSVS